MADSGSVAVYAGGIETGDRDQTEPQRDEADVELAAGGDDVAVDVGAGHLREDRLEARRLRRGRPELADAHVRRAGHPGDAVAPRLTSAPTP